MYQKAILNVAVIPFLFLAAVWSIWEIKQCDVKAFASGQDAVLTKEQSVMEINGEASSSKRILTVDVLEKQYEHQLDAENLDVLCRIVEAEAGCEDEEGKLLVANVVLNRVESEEFPNTVKEVVFQKENGVSQFSPVSDGRYYTVEISDETRAAVEKAMQGEDNSEGALFFAAREYADSDRMKWFDNQLKFLFKHGGHEFYTLAK